MKKQRIAVVLSGMIRNFEHTVPFIKKHIDNSKSLSEFEIDYFFFGYPNKLGKDYCASKIKDLYAVKQFELIEWNDEIKSIIEADAGGLQDLEGMRKGSSTQVVNCLSSHRCRYLSNQLRKNWSSKNGVKHKAVISARTDSFFFRDLLKEEVDRCLPNVVLIPSDWDFKEFHPHSVSDMFAMGDDVSMDRYFEAYYRMPVLSRVIGTFTPEQSLGFHVHDSGLERQVIDRHIAFEYPYSKDDVLNLWKDTWSQEEVEIAIGFSTFNINHSHRKTF